MAKVKLTDYNNTPGAQFNLEGGVMAWQDWMCDSISLMAVFDQPGSTPNRIQAFSFISGAVLASTAASTDEIARFASASQYILACENLGTEHNEEGMILKNEPVDHTGMLTCGIQLQTTGNLEGAIEQYKGVLKAIPRLPRVANLMGLCLRLTGKMDEAEQAYLKEMENSPDFPDAYCNLGILYLKIGREQPAHSMFEKALDRDQFYLNALLQLSKLLADSKENRFHTMLASINHRLLTAYADIPQVQEHLTRLAAASGLSGYEFAAQLGSASPVLSDAGILLLMKKVESLRLNGAHIATARGLYCLLEKTIGTPGERFFLFWVARRLQSIGKKIPEGLRLAWEKVTSELFNSFPAVKQQDMSRLPPQIRTGDALTPEEFFEIVLVEILRDGQIKPEESSLLLRLKNALRIDDSTHSAVFSKVEKRFRANPMVDDGGSLDPERLFKLLVIAVLRDGKVEEQEKKLLGIAGDSLQLSMDRLKAIVAEIQR